MHPVINVYFVDVIHFVACEVILVGESERTGGLEEGL
jgi:hypothetical protein